jgi:hypothetical protein
MRVVRSSPQTCDGSIDTRYAAMAQTRGGASTLNRENGRE